MTTTVHDTGYKRLLSNRTIFRQIIESFVEEDWVQRLDFDRAERLDKSFIAEHYKETESDLIYKVPLQDSDKVIYFYLLIEFQSSVQRFMVLRTLYYVCSFYLDYLLSYKNVEKLPVLFPLVLYNGEDRWTAPDNIADLIESTPSLGKYALNFEQMVIAENEYGKDTLLNIHNIASTLFLAEAHYNVALLLKEILEVYDAEPDKQAMAVFLNWFRQLAAHGYIPTDDFAKIEHEYKNREEVKSMLVKSLERDRLAYKLDYEQKLLEIEREKLAIEEEKQAINAKVQAIEEKKQAVEEEKQAVEEEKQAVEEEKQAIAEKKQEIEARRQALRQSGKFERNREIAHAMREKGYALPIIADILGLSEDHLDLLLTDSEN